MIASWQVDVVKIQPELARTLNQSTCRKAWKWASSLLLKKLSSVTDNIHLSSVTDYMNVYWQVDVVTPKINKIRGSHNTKKLFPFRAQSLATSIHLTSFSCPKIQNAVKNVRTR